ncbi:transmembrane di-hem cytochrome [Viridothelium virens]|uniref:Cytochrome b n=1 Tax=Viridothelium virens TaxID=1048519 RepID=A0A6A6GSE8_VIRVR|nr:transmembrane di-hem cytochrome [Viridothelium virens]
MRILKSNPLFRLVNDFLGDAPQPSNLIIQIITGVTLAMHYNPTSAFFFLVYLHIGRVIFILMMAIAFLGYVLPYGQMSGFSVNNATLNRFFALHFVLPFVLAALVLMHLIVLHDGAGSSNPLGVSDLITIFLFILILSIFVFFMPNVLGVIAMFSAIIILLTLPFMDLNKGNGIQYRSISRIAFFIFVADFLLLMKLGAVHVESPFIELGQICTIIYFMYFLIIIPFISLLENSLVDLNNN